MRKKRLLWQLYPSYIVIVLLSILSVTWYASIALREFYLDQVAADLEARSILIEPSVSKLINDHELKKIDSLAKELGAAASMRITVILPDGRVTGDTENDPAQMDNHSDRPEVIDALAGRTGTSIRFSYTLNQQMMYVTIPVESGGSIVGVLRSSLPLTFIYKALNVIYIKIVFGCIVAIILVAVISLIISKRISSPLVELKRGAELFAKGDLKHKLRVFASYEIGALANAMNQMAAELDERISTIELQRNEQNAVLSSMVESVFAVDMAGNLVSMNQAAERLFSINIKDVRGRNIQEAVRNSDLLNFVVRTLESHDPIEDDITLKEDDERFLIVHGTILRNSSRKSIGALVVLNDVTRIRRLENIRRDFVANVSHEIKTPLTSIKAYVETLLDGAMNRPDDATRFLEIIARQADRLNAITEDLLTLARIEQSGKEHEILMRDVKVTDIMQAAGQTCKMKAAEKNIQLIFDCDESLHASLNPQLIEQALVNLVENAIKYSEPKSAVNISANIAGHRLTIAVRDEGGGIAKEHHGRLFERFYRVDKARSRKLGGTGLGLAIVKHISKLHGGDVSVDSAPGKGSAFLINLPIDQPPIFH